MVVAQDTEASARLAKNQARGGTWLGDDIALAIERNHYQLFDSYLKATSCRPRRAFFRPSAAYLTVQCPGLHYKTALEALAALPGVLSADADYVEVEESTDQPDSFEWHLHNTGQTIDGVRGVPGADINLLAAREVHNGERAPLVAVIDTGIWPEHVDFGGVYRFPDEICDNGRDDDGNGFVDDCRGWDFGDEDTTPSPTTLPERKSNGNQCSRWHGHAMSGLIGADASNGLGGVGVVSGAPLLNIKKHPDETCISSTSRSIEAIAYALDAGAKVILMSFSTSSYNATLEALLIEAEAMGAVLIMSAGNSGHDVEENPRYPAYFNLRAPLVVANSTNQDTLGSGSNYGAVHVDFAAPGSDIWVAEIDSERAYGWHTGTSYAAAIVAGGVALLRSAYPSLSNEEIVSALLAGAEPLDALDCAVTNRCVRSGSRMDLFHALAAARELTSPHFYADWETPQLEPGDEVSFDVVLTNLDLDDLYQVEVLPSLGASSGLELSGSAASLATFRAGDEQVFGRDWLLSVPEGCTENSSELVSLSVSDFAGAVTTIELPVVLVCDQDAPIPEPPVYGSPDEECEEDSECGDGGGLVPSLSPAGTTSSGCNVSTPVSAGHMGTLLLLLGGLFGVLRRRA